MSINQYLSSDIPETLWWSTQQQQPTVEPSPKTLLSPMYRHHQPPSAPHSPTFNFNIIHRENHTEFVQSPEVETPTNNYTKEQEEQPKEPMFEKPLTPSDVGKLNRLVIPKQHAEKYFPLGGGNGNGTDSSVEKGLLLNFEDEIGKSWRFRYSYWNSSQSYVLTKGWSRFVKEKRLDAGDIVMFERHRLDGDRLFIGWRRRAMVVPTSSQDGGHMGFVAHHHHLQGAAGVAVAGGGGNIGGWTRVFYNAQHAYPSHPGGGGGGNGSCIPYQPDCPHAGSNVHNNNNGQTTPSVNPKRSVRLFGVNLECQTDDDDDPEPVTPPGGGGGGSPISSHGSQPQYISSSNHNFLDMNLCRDVNQMSYQYQQQYHQG